MDGKRFGQTSTPKHVSRDRKAGMESPCSRRGQFCGGDGRSSSASVLAARCWAARSGGRGGRRRAARSASARPRPPCRQYHPLPGAGRNGGGACNRGADGLTHTNATRAVTPAPEATYSPFGPDGYPAIDQHTRKVFQAAGFPNGDGSYDLELNIGTPDAAGNLTFLDAPTASSNGGPNYEGLIHIADNLPGSPDTLFSVASIDSARNLFVAWAVKTSNPGQDQVYVSASSAASGWRTWTKPVQVSNASSGTGDAVNVFPWLKAGAPGRPDPVRHAPNPHL